MRRYIDAIRLVDRSEATCIEVDHPRHLFLTEGFIPTHNTRGVILNTQVLAACNSSAKFTPEFLSRFALHAHFPQYTRQEFMDVCTGFLVKAEKCPAEIAAMIGQMIFEYNLGDVRKARGCWQLMNVATESEVQRVIALMIKYGPDFKSDRRVKGQKQLV
jgi:hypothetical protein